MEQLDIDVNLDRENHNKKPLKPRKVKEDTKEIKKDVYKRQTLHRSWSKPQIITLSKGIFKSV